MVEFRIIVDLYSCSNLITGKNSMVRKFHRLGNSILILDEVQSIRHELWPLVKQALAFLTNRLKSYVVFVTATDPLIFPREELISLADREKYFRDLKRVHVEVNLKKQTLEEFIDRLSFEPNKTCLFILNTIGSAEILCTAHQESTRRWFPFKSRYSKATSGAYRAN